jgi:hypothetical protein
VLLRLLLRAQEWEEVRQVQQAGQEQEGWARRPLPLLRLCRLGLLLGIPPTRTDLDLELGLEAEQHQEQHQHQHQHPQCRLRPNSLRGPRPARRPCLRAARRCGWLVGLWGMCSRVLGSKSSGSRTSGEETWTRMLRVDDTSHRLCNAASTRFPSLLSHVIPWYIDTQGT